MQIEAKRQSEPHNIFSNKEPSRKEQGRVPYPEVVSQDGLPPLAKKVTQHIPSEEQKETIRRLEEAIQAGQSNGSCELYYKQLEETPLQNQLLKATSSQVVLFLFLRQTNEIIAAKGMPCVELPSQDQPRQEKLVASIKIQASTCRALPTDPPFLAAWQLAEAAVDADCLWFALKIIRSLHDTFKHHCDYAQLIGKIIEKSTTYPMRHLHREEDAQAYMEMSTDVCALHPINTTLMLAYYHVNKIGKLQECLKSSSKGIHLIFEEKHRKLFESVPTVYSIMADIRTRDVMEKIQSHHRCLGDLLEKANNQLDAVPDNDPSLSAYQSSLSELKGIISTPKRP